MEILVLNILSLLKLFQTERMKKDKNNKEEN